MELANNTLLVGAALKSEGIFQLSAGQSVASNFSRNTKGQRKGIVLGAPFQANST